MSDTKTARVASVQPRKIFPVNFAAKIARKLHLELISRTLEIIEMEPELAGYVIIAWDHRGCVTTAMQTKHGPIAHNLAPSYVADALNRRVGADDAVYRITGKDPDDEPA